MDARFSGKLGIGMVVLLATTLAAGASAAAPAPRSHSEALQRGDAAATAPSFSEDADGAVYRGQPVDGQTIIDRGLSCLAIDKGPSRCYDSPEALQAKELGPQATASCGVYEILIIWVSADYAGANAAFAERGRWANLRAEINNHGSSFVMGDHSGHLADGQDGLGFWYPGNTGVCAHENNLNTNGSGWNNRISSRYRN